MRRKMKLICKILAYAESAQTTGIRPIPEIDGHNDEEVYYHVELCIEAGYLRGHAQNGIAALTWAGHNALEKLRDSKN